MTPTNPAQPGPTPQPNPRNADPIAGRIDPAAPPPNRPPAAETPPAGLNAGPDVKALLRSLGRRWVLAAVLSILVGGAVAVGVYALLTPDYTAFAQVRVGFNDIVVLGDPQRSQTGFGPFIKSQAAVFKSRPTIQAALKKDEVRRLNLDAETTDLPAYVEERLKIDVQDTSEFMTATLSHRDPIVAVALIQALTESYMEHVESEKDLRTQRDTQLEGLITGLKTGMDQKKKALKDLAKQLKTTDRETLNRMREEAAANVKDLRAQRNPIRTALTKAEAELKALDVPIPTITPVEPPSPPPPPPIEKVRVEEAHLAAALASDAVAAGLRGRINAAQDVMRYYEDKVHQPQQEVSWQRARRDLAALQGQLAQRRADLRGELEERANLRYQEEVARQKAMLDAESRRQQYLVQASAQQVQLHTAQALAQKTAQKQILADAIGEFKRDLDQIDEAIEEEQAKAATLTGAGAETEALEKEIAAQQARIDELKERLENNKINSQINDRIRVHQKAEIMRQNAKKQVLATAAAPVVVTMAICLLLAYVDYRQRRVYSAREVATGLGIRVVGTVPALPGLERRLVDPGAETDLEGHPVLESIDALRTTLLRESQRDRRRVILVTSASPGEGKTTLAASLAISLARAGRKTLLIDGDLRGPTVNQLFELPLQPGFSEVVLAEVDAIDAIQPTHIDNLSVLPGGQYDREVLQSLARDGLDGVLEKLRDEYDFILIDSHPVLAATDSLLLAQKVDGVLLAVLRGVSQMPHVYAAAQRLSSLGVRVLGAVMNASAADEVPTFAPTGAPVAAA